MDIVRENFLLQEGFSCYGTPESKMKDCRECFNEIPCHWYLSLTSLFSDLDRFFSLGSW